MRKIHHYHRRLKLAIIRTIELSLIICAFLLPSYMKCEKTGNNLYTISHKGVEIGKVASLEKVDEYINAARKRVVGTEKELVMMDVSFDVTGEEVFFGRVDSRDVVVDRMASVMQKSRKDTLQHCYTVKINETTVNLATYEEVERLLQEAIAPYDTENEYVVELVLDPTREVNVLTTQVLSKESKSAENVTYSAGVTYVLEQAVKEAGNTETLDFEDYTLGLIDIAYADKIEVIEAYLLPGELTPVEEAIDLVTKEQETQIIYKVVAGDSLSKISYENNIPIDTLIEMNDAIENENSTIRVDQEILINVPEPDLSVIWKEEQIYVEDYEAEIQYVPNDDWYTTQQVTLQEPSAGRRKVVAVTTYKNAKEESREILKEEIYAQAVPKIVERGTKIPPTYVKPISGGRVSSGFGARSAPTKGASTYHQGVDWAVATGTPVYASNGGTVAAAGWMSGYGYAVYINHADGRQTRYGHLSKVLVSAGQTVSQGQKIALSGNSGRSTGPHLHFEIRINGTAVNPLKYLN